MSSTSSIKGLPEVGAVHCLSLEAFKSLLVPFEEVYLCKLTRELLGSDPAWPRQRLSAVHLTARCAHAPIRFLTVKAAWCRGIGQQAELCYPTQARGSWSEVCALAQRLQDELAACLEQLLQASPRCHKVVTDARHWLPDNVVWATPLGEVRHLALKAGQ
jgi:hypothetical protein